MCSKVIRRVLFTSVLILISAFGILYNLKTERAAASMVKKTEIFTSTSTSPFYITPNMHAVNVTMGAIGGGGGGGGAYAKGYSGIFTNISGAGGGGGGGGGHTSQNVAAGALFNGTFTYTVGGGGAGGVGASSNNSSSNGTAGTQSTIAFNGGSPLAATGGAEA